MKFNEKKEGKELSAYIDEHLHFVCVLLTTSINPEALFDIILTSRRRTWKCLLPWTNLKTIMCPLYMHLHTKITWNVIHWSDAKWRVNCSSKMKGEWQHINQHREIIWLNILPYNALNSLYSRVHLTFNEKKNFFGDAREIRYDLINFFPHFNVGNLLTNFYATHFSQWLSFWYRKCAL